MSTASIHTELGINYIGEIMGKVRQVIEARIGRIKSILEHDFDKLSEVAYHQLHNELRILDKLVAILEEEK